ncbi:DUF6891 domain-containing protein, partial [Longimicrobium sp.]|uniref:DUF6891 domain-containing protein n=1 Tax=Longimicrobium sp. TaxID=2029185 RepID=UPI002E3625F8
DDVMDELRDAVRRELRMGFTPADEIVEVAVEVMDGQERLRPAAEHLFRVESQALRREQATWPAETDCDRLDRAFEALEERGIVARQNFSCCQSCGSREIWGEVDEAEEMGMDVRGHTYYHVQDTEGAVEGGGLHLAYGAMEEGGIVDVGREIVEVLNAHGLATDWNGSPDLRIHVQLDWKRRRDDL